MAPYLHPDARDVVSGRGPLKVYIGTHISEDKGWRELAQVLQGPLLSLWVSVAQELPTCALTATMARDRGCHGSLVELCWIFLSGVETRSIPRKHGWAVSSVRVRDSPPPPSGPSGPT